MGWRLKFVIRLLGLSCRWLLIRGSGCAMRWIKQYGVFDVKLMKDEVTSGCRLDLGNTDIRGLLWDDELLEVFVASLTLQKVDFSVPRAARRFLSTARMRLGCKSLNDNKSLSEIIRGYERSTPRTVIQAEAFEVYAWRGSQLPMVVRHRGGPSRSLAW